MYQCDFCQNEGIKKYYYRAKAIKAAIKVNLCDECAEKEKNDIVMKISEKGEWDGCTKILGANRKDRQSYKKQKV